MRRAADSTPDDRDVKTKLCGDGRQHRRMSKRVGTVRNARTLRAKVREQSRPRLEIAHHGFAARNEVVGEDVPWPGFEHTSGEMRAKRRLLVWPHRQKVGQQDRLPVEQERRGALDRSCQQRVDERNQPLPKSTGGVIPLPVPVRVRDEMHLQPRCIRDGAMGVRRG